jgi:hypothetical protein
MIWKVKVHKGKYMEEEEYYTASEALKDFLKACKKHKGKKIIVTMEDQDNNRLLLRNLKK